MEETEPVDFHVMYAGVSDEAIDLLQRMLVFSICLLEYLNRSQQTHFRKRSFRVTFLSLCSKTRDGSSSFNKNDIPFWIWHSKWRRRKISFETINISGSNTIPVIISVYTSSLVKWSSLRIIWQVEGDEAILSILLPTFIRFLPILLAIQEFFYLQVLLIDLHLDDKKNCCIM